MRPSILRVVKLFSSKNSSISDEFGELAISFLKSLPILPSIKLKTSKIPVIPVKPISESSGLICGISRIALSEV